MMEEKPLTIMCEDCKIERRLYHPCPKCGKPTFKPRAK
jgi:Zn finger protein HypA/HybF involved in hydrogenase expression